MPLLRADMLEIEWDAAVDVCTRRMRSREKRLRRKDHAGDAEVCRSKLAYASWADAWHVVHRISSRYSRQSNEPYRCQVCKGIHIRTLRGPESLRLRG